MTEEEDAGIRGGRVILCCPIHSQRPPGRDSKEPQVDPPATIASERSIDSGRFINNHKGCDGHPTRAEPEITSNVRKLVGWVRGVSDVRHLLHPLDGHGLQIVREADTAYGKLAIECPVNIRNAQGRGENPKETVNTDGDRE